MTKRYAVLQKKLEELESELIEVFSLPAETPCHHLVSEGIEQRFVFLKNLLSAEIASHPTKPHHLQHIAHRLTELETAFHNWDDLRSTSALNDLDTASTCSCTESCLNDDGEGSVYEDPERFSEGVIEGPIMVEPERDGRREEGRVWVGRYCGVMVGVVLMGFVIMVGFSGCFHYIEHESFLIPT